MDQKVVQLLESDTSSAIEDGIKMILSVRKN